MPTSINLKEHLREDLEDYQVNAVLDDPLLSNILRHYINTEKKCEKDKKKSKDSKKEQKETVDAEETCGRKNTAPKDSTEEPKKTLVTEGMLCEAKLTSKYDFLKQFFIPGLYSPIPPRYIPTFRQRLGATLKAAINVGDIMTSDLDVHIDKVLANPVVTRAIHQAMVYNYVKDVIEPLENPEEKYKLLEKSKDGVQKLAAESAVESLKTKLENLSEYKLLNNKVETLRTAFGETKIYIWHKNNKIILISEIAIVAAGAALFVNNLYDKKEDKLVPGLLASGIKAVGNLALNAVEIELEDVTSSIINLSDFEFDPTHLEQKRLSTVGEAEINDIDSVLSAEAKKKHIDKIYEAYSHKTYQSRLSLKLNYKGEFSSPNQEKPRKIAASIKIDNKPTLEKNADLTANRVGGVQAVDYHHNPDGDWIFELSGSFDIGNLGLSTSTRLNNHQSTSKYSLNYKFGNINTNATLTDSTMLDTERQTTLSTSINYESKCFTIGGKINYSNVHNVGEAYSFDTQVNFKPNDNVDCFIKGSLNTSDKKTLQDSLPKNHLLFGVKISF